MNWKHLFVLSALTNLSTTINAWAQSSDCFSGLPQLAGSSPRRSLALHFHKPLALLRTPPRLTGELVQRLGSQRDLGDSHMIDLPPVL